MENYLGNAKSVAAEAEQWNRCDITAQSSGCSLVGSGISITAAL